MHPEPPPRAPTERRPPLPRRLLTGGLVALGTVATGSLASAGPGSGSCTGACASCGTCVVALPLLTALGLGLWLGARR